MNSTTSILISACLIGEPCRFDGQSKERTDLLDLLKEYNLIAVCPEVAGGLPTPRPPAEITGTQVLRENGEDVTAQFQTGSQECLDRGITENTSRAILKSRSPACGCGQIYDGTFTGKLIDGDGIFTQTLKTAGIECISDKDYLKI